MNLFKSIITTTPTVWQVLLVVAISILFGVVFSILYTKFKQKDNFFKDMPISFILFPFIVTVLTLTIEAIAFQFTGNELTSRATSTGISLAAAFIMLRFRSEPRNIEDLTYIFALTGVGMLLGIGYLLIAVLFYVVLLAIVVTVYLLGYPKIDSRMLKLQITIPEDLNYENAFDDIFEKYTSQHELTKVKTSDMGTMFVVNYDVKMKDDISKKDFIDELRTRNGNLTILLTVKKFES